MTKSEPQEVADALRDELTLICQAQEAWKKAKGETRTPLLGELLEWLVVRTGLSDLLGVLETTDEENATLTRERDEALRQRDWYRERVVWTFTEEETPKYFQGLEGESEINAPTTALEVTILREERDEARERNSEDAEALRDGLVKIHRERAEKAECERDEARADLERADLERADISLRETTAALVAMRDILRNLLKDSCTYYPTGSETQCVRSHKSAYGALAAPLPALAAQIEAVMTAARAMPRRVPHGGGASTVHSFEIEAATIWALDKALAELSPTPAAKEDDRFDEPHGGHEDYPGTGGVG